MVEYGLLIAMIAIVSLVAVGGAGRATEEKFDVIAAGMEGSSGSLSGENEESDESAAPADSDDELGSAPGGSDDEGGTPGGSDDDLEEQGDEQGGPSDSDDSDSGPVDDDSDNSSGGTGDDDGGDGGSAPDPEDEPADDPVVPGSTVANPGSTSSFYWWNTTKNGGTGAWKSSVTYENDWIRHQYLTLEVTRVDEKGKRSTSTVKDFYVPAGGSTSYEAWDNELTVNKDKLDGVVSVEVKVVSIRTSDEAWKTVSYPTDGPTTVVQAPTVP